MTRLKICLTVTTSLLAVLFSACQGPAAVSPLPTEETCTLPEVSKSGSPELSSALKRGCPQPGTTGFNSAGLAEGQIAVDFTLNSAPGNRVSLSGLLAQKPVVMVLGSFT